MRLDKFLADMNVGNRSELKKDIRKGRVSVNGMPVRDPGLQLQASDTVTYDGRPVQYEQYVYYMLHKPAGVISASEDKKQQTVIDLLQDPARKDLFPVGRLDKDTEGLLLITNDGDLAHRLLSPKKHVDKLYFARVSGMVTGEDVDRFAAGLTVDESLTALPAVLKVLSAAPDGSEVEVTIREGKFHQIKRMFQAVGKEVLYLKRLSMGPLVLDETLKAGESRRLTPAEIQMLKSH